MGVSTRSARCVSPAVIRRDADATIMATIEEQLGRAGGGQMGVPARSERCASTAMIWREIMGTAVEQLERAGGNHGSYRRARRGA